MLSAIIYSVAQSEKLPYLKLQQGQYAVEGMQGQVGLVVQGRLALICYNDQGRKEPRSQSRTAISCDKAFYAVSTPTFLADKPLPHHQ